MATNYSLTRLGAPFWPRAARLGRTVWAAGIGWPLIAAVVLVVGAFQPWLGVPLIYQATSWQLPLDFGWGIHSGLLSFGLLTVVLALGFIVRLVLAVDGRYLGFAARWVRPLRSRTLVGLGALCFALPLLVLWQYTMADLHQMALLASYENQSLLIQKHLAYHFPAQHIPMLPFQVDVSSIGARATLLYQLAGPGIYVALLAGVVCWYGAFALRHQTHSSTGITDAANNEGLLRNPRLWWVLGGVLALIIFGRAPLGLWFEHQGQNSMTMGNYATAQQQFAQAQAVNPALTMLPSFHQERGAALFHQQQTQDLDAGLFLAAQYRAVGALDLAWRTDQSLMQQYGKQDSIVQDSVTTLEMLAERDSNTGLTHDQRVALARYPLDALPNASQVLPTIAVASTRLDALLAIQPNNVYAHYLHGFILYATHMYDPATQDFQEIQNLTSDRNMQSIDMTYLAFCRAGDGDNAGERSLLQKAVALDYGYYNTIAREAASGLH